MITDREEAALKMLDRNILLRNYSIAFGLPIIWTPKQVLEITRAMKLLLSLHTIDIANFSKEWDG